MPRVFVSFADARYHVGDVVRKLRECAGWTTQRMATITGVRPKAINNLEKGYTKRPKPQTLDRLAAPFGLTGADLLAAVPSQTALFEAVFTKAAQVAPACAPSRVRDPKAHTKRRPA